MVKKNQSAGIQDKMVRAITRMLSDYYKYLVQMMIVWYDEDHSFVHDAGDGEFDYITLNRGLIEEGIRVKAGKPQNPDNARVEAITLKLLEQKGISLLDAYKLLKLPNPQQLYDNWAKQNADPISLAREVSGQIDDAEAYVIYQDIMDGKKVEEKQNPTKEFVLALRKLMIDDEFLNAPISKQRKFIAYVDKCLDSLEVRLELDQAGQEDPTGQNLRPEQPLQPLAPPQMPGMGMPGAMPPMGAPGMMPMPPGGQPPMPMGQPMPGMAPPQAPAPMTPSSVYAAPPAAPPEPAMPSVVQ
jgi:hypothetical protein